MVTFIVILFVAVCACVASIAVIGMYESIDQNKRLEALTIANNRHSLERQLMIRK